MVLLTAAIVTYLATPVVRRVALAVGAASYTHLTLPTICSV